MYLGALISSALSVMAMMRFASFFVGGSASMFQLEVSGSWRWWGIRSMTHWIRDVPLCLYTYMYMRMFVYICVHISICICICMCTYKYIYMYMCMYMYVYVRSTSLFTLYVYIAQVWQTGGEVLPLALPSLAFPYHFLGGLLFSLG